MRTLHHQPAATIGEKVRSWRQRRKLSQLDFALEVEISQKHLSFIESGRSHPSRAMVLRLAQSLAVPLRERNAMLLAAGFAPSVPEMPLSAPEMTAAREAVERLLAAHEPFPALAVDRHWTLVAANEAVRPFLALARDPRLVVEPVNVLRLSLHPDGLGPHIVNGGEWRAHVLTRLRRQADESGDPSLSALLDELNGLPGPEAVAGPPASGVLVPFQVRLGDRVLSFLSTTTVFGTPLEITLSELAIEAFFPADPDTASALRGGFGEAPQRPKGKRRASSQGPPR
jgi:transcriptional regulator with XRE-family HTH domain